MPNSHFRGLGLTCDRCLHVTGDPAEGTSFLNIMVFCTCYVSLLAYVMFLVTIDTLHANR